MLGSSEHIGVIVTKLKNSTRESGSFYNKCIREWAYIPCRFKLFVPTCPSWYTYGLLADDMLDLGRNTASHIKFNVEWNRKYYMDFRYPATQDRKHAQTQKNDERRSYKRVPGASWKIVWLFRSGAASDGRANIPPYDRFQKHVSIPEKDRWLSAKAFSFTNDAIKIQARE